MGILSKIADKLRPHPAAKNFEPAVTKKASDDLHIEAWTRLDRAVKNSPNPAELTKAKELAETKIAKETPEYFRRIDKEVDAYNTLAAQAEKVAQYKALERRS